MEEQLSVRPVDDVTADCDAYWEKTSVVYDQYPTIRHRRRFLLDRVTRELEVRGVRRDGLRAFDYGCGNGQLLHALSVASPHRLELAGCELSPVAVDLARRRVPTAQIYEDLFPDSVGTFDIITCSEVLEHTVGFKKILLWIAAHMRPGGTLLLTTQSGRLHASDRFAGHKQHFDCGELRRHAEDVGLEVVEIRQWGFPLFSLQKRLTDFQFDRIRSGFMVGDLTRGKRFIYSATYFAYFVHDLIPLGPQIYLVAKAPQA